jgi:hypothetical protein
MVQFIVEKSHIHASIVTKAQEVDLNVNYVTNGLHTLLRND